MVATGVCLRRRYHSTISERGTDRKPRSQEVKPTNDPRIARSDHGLLRPDHGIPNMSLLTTRKPAPDTSPKATFKLWCGRRLRRKFHFLRLSIKPRFGCAITTMRSRDLLVIPGTSFNHLSVLNHIMGLALQHPITDRRLKRDCLAVKRHLPVRRCEWCDDLLATAAATTMRRCRILKRHIENTWLKALRDMFHETMFEPVVPHHSKSPLIIRLPSVV